ncbi:hypothetical protein SAMN05660477_01023 [Soonwooa buanensis]|uniref:Lipoprotein n=1 Tax=Soonwooa buanensis TaxID=619805 RepID=A0A1T5DUG1_9FLAO|nr:hypothetical protein [Soonwooa buanensis]SKB75315.1 hypothetical protein SAMN05660477_01023 [Soonwooa buanensis]
MNIKNLILGSVTLSAFFSCSSLVKNEAETGNIVRDCTGTYIRIAGKGDFLVCNDKLIKDKKDGEKLNVSYEMTKDCSERDGIVTCMMYHEHKGLIRITSFK